VPTDRARAAAYDLLRAVAVDDAYANLVWPRILAEHRLAGRDAAFATELAYGTLRWRGRHDAILAACIDRDPAQVQPELLDALRLGTHQLLEMRVGAHAAVDQSVELVRARVNPGAAGFANAVLRRVARGGTSDQWLDGLVAAGAVPSFRADPVGHLAIATSHPEWIVRAVHEALAASAPDRTWEDTRTALHADNAPGTVTLVARSVDRAELMARLDAQDVTAEPGSLSRMAVRVSAVNPSALPEVATGAAGVQDEGSQVVALLLADAELEGPDAQWLDLCAGPGGKSALLAGEAARRGGTLTAVELHPHRAELVRTALRTVPGVHRVLTADATVADIGSGYDRVLVDAPCTGLGALRRRPESRWRRSPEDLAALTALQRRLLCRALAVVRPGGLVLYATCSPHVAETEVVVGDVAKWGGSVVALGGTPGVTLPAGSSTGAFLRLWPHVHDTDGMFAALIRRDR
jgi:16S rRNA (cytosine967-C5)-methyltransferase